MIVKFYTLCQGAYWDLTAERVTMIRRTLFRVALLAGFSVLAVGCAIQT